MKEEIVFNVFEGGFSVITDSNDFECGIGSFYVKDNKVFIKSYDPKKKDDKVTYKFFGSSLVPFIETKKSRWYLKGKARNIALTFKAKLSYSNAKLYNSVGSIELFYNEDPKRWILQFKGEVIIITKNKKEALLKAEQYLGYTFPKEPTKTIPKVYMGDVDSIYEGVEDFQSREEELKEAINVILSMRGRSLLQEEYELLKELKSEIEFLI